MIFVSNVVAIIQARMGSTRLPGKILKEVLGKPLLEYQIERVRKSKLIDKIVIATTTDVKEQPLIEVCHKLGLDVYKGSEEDVLSRYYDAATEYKADLIVRITSDCPIIDPIIIDNVVEKYLSGKFDYVSNTLERTFPRGMDVEIFSYKVLKEAYINSKKAFEREHVTSYIYLNPNLFTLGNVKYSSNESEHRWTVDTIEDFVLIEKIIMHLAEKNFTMEDVLYLLNNNPGWKSINAHIEQKKVGE